LLPRSRWPGGRAPSCWRIVRPPAWTASRCAAGSERKVAQADIHPSRLPPSGSVVAARPAQASRAATGPWSPSGLATRRAAPSARKASATSVTSRRPSPRRRRSAQTTMPHSATDPASSGGCVAATPTSASPFGRPGPTAHTARYRQRCGLPLVGHAVGQQPAGRLALRWEPEPAEHDPGHGTWRARVIICSSVEVGSRILPLAAWRPLGGSTCNRPSRRSAAAKALLACCGQVSQRTKGAGQ
jgi:hypothetical protein